MRGDEKQKEKEGEKGERVVHSSVRRLKFHSFCTPLRILGYIIGVVVQFIHPKIRYIIEII